MILKTRALSIVGSAYRLIGKGSLTYATVSYATVSFCAVGKGSLSSRGCPICPTCPICPICPTMYQYG